MGWIISRILAIVLLSTLRGALSAEVGKSSCDGKKFASLRSEWSSSSDPCQKKLSFELWALMKAEGNANDADAKHVRAECITGITGPLRLELITPEDWDSTMVKETCDGTIAGETKHSALFLCKDARDLEVFCADDAITGVSHIAASTSRGSAPPRRSRRLKETESEAGVLHNVAGLIEGLQALGCQRTTGEDQTLCIISDSYNHNGAATFLQASGDLPPVVDVVKELRIDENTSPGTDEGSAMMELAYDIASGANFKFNTGFHGIQAFADDVFTLAADEACDVIVDDITLFAEPGFRDGVITEAVNHVSDDGTLFFTSAGNDASARRFSLNIECSSFFDGVGHEACEDGSAALHVFNPNATGIERYEVLITPSCGQTVQIKWDEDDATSRDMGFLSSVIQADGTRNGWLLHSKYSTGIASDYLSLDVCDVGLEGQEFVFAIIQLDSPFEPVDMMLVTDNGFEGFDEGSIVGHHCASKAVSVAAIDYDAATWAGGAFNDPEPASVASYSSRGPCTIDGGSGIELRDHPVITAASSLQTSTAGFDVFPGTSAAAPVAAAIATIIRAACYPNKLVTYTEIMEMMTNYDYTIDVTSDAGGAAETWGREAGHGIISADQLLLWVAQNCQATCPGTSSTTPGVTDSPTVAPVETLTASPTSVPVSSSAPVVTLTASPTSAPVSSSAPVAAPTPKTFAPIGETTPVAALTPKPVAPTSPVAAPTTKPVAPTRSTPKPVAPTAPVAAPTTKPVAPTRPTPKPVAPTAPVSAPTPKPVAPTAPVAAPTPKCVAPPAPVAAPTPKPVAPTAPVATPTSKPVAPTGGGTGGKCSTSDLSDAQVDQLAIYDKGLYADPDCVNGSVPTPLLCNYMGIGQDCRGCYMTCDGAMKYKHENPDEVATWGETAFFNFCPGAEIDKIGDC